MTYVYDNNGNLTNDGVNTYTYDSANRLTALSNQQSAMSYRYNGLGDRLSQTRWVDWRSRVETVNGVTTNYTLDLNAGLTQVLNDGTNVYVYGLGRIAQVNTSTEYFLGDALGSVRQLTDASGQVTLTKAYTPYGETRSSLGSGTSIYSYTGEQQDVSGLTYLRSRYYLSNTGRFISRDTWSGNENMPMSFNRWNYVGGNPINRLDPSGHCYIDDQSEECVPYYPSPIEPPNTTGYNEKTSPRNISWNPTQNPLAKGALGVTLGNKAQYHVPGWEDNYGLCGLVSLAAILASYGISAKDVVDLFSTIITADPNYQSESELIDFVTKAYSDKLIIEDLTREGASIDGFKKILRDSLSPSTVIMAGVEIDSGGKIISSATAKARLEAVIKYQNDPKKDSKKKPQGLCDPGVICHWVVVTGTSRQWREGDNYSKWNWIRVYNPFDNQTEYYWYPDFYTSKATITGWTLRVTIR